MHLEDMLTLGLIGVNILLTVILVVVHLRNYKAIASKITLGFLVFAGAFLVENILNFYFYNSLLEQALYGMTTFNLAVNFLEMIALLVLAWVTYK